MYIILIVIKNWFMSKKEGSMCGLAGYLNLSSPHFHLDESLLHAMQQTIAHRGPNGWRSWTSTAHQIALVHRRLSIIDLAEHAFQPMLNDAGTLVVSFNGEIYNHRALRATLESLGYRYRTQSDTETILHAYHAWGIDFLHRLHGMFAITLFDLRTNELYLIRDRIGIKPLYFSTQGGILSFASEMKALWPLPWIAKAINHAAVPHYLTYMVTPAPMTIYKDIYKLPAGFYMKVDAQRALQFCEWYNPVRDSAAAPAALVQDEQACIEHLRMLLRASIKEQMIADVPIGVFLSGGVDSSLTVALMAELTNNVNTFTIASAHSEEHNETAWARRVANHFNTQHREITIDEHDAFAFFQAMLHHHDEPLADCVSIPLFYVSKLLHDTSTAVVLVGEGSDELFCGYSSYAHYLNTYRIWQPSQHYMPAIARKAAYAAIAPWYAHKRNTVDIMRNWAAGKELFVTGALAFSAYWQQEIMHTKEYEPDPMLAQIYPGLPSLQDQYAFAEYHRAQLRQYDPSADHFKAMTYLELKQRLPELLLMRVDKMAMATSVEGRVPFLDHRIVEFALQIPTHMKYRNGITKYILKKACEGIVPHEIIYRTKIGFAAPTKQWFKQGTHFLPYFTHMLTRAAAHNHHSLKIDAVQKLLTEHQTTNRDYACQLWVVQNLLATMEA
jgi:asparagine synthase (glutamine-hydrolysing)